MKKVIFFPIASCVIFGMAMQTGVCNAAENIFVPKNETLTDEEDLQNIQTDESNEASTDVNKTATINQEDENQKTGTVENFKNLPENNNSTEDKIYNEKALKKKTPIKNVATATNSKNTSSTNNTTLYYSAGGILVSTSPLLYFVARRLKQNSTKSENISGNNESTNNQEESNKKLDDNQNKEEKDKKISKNNKENEKLNNQTKNAEDDNEDKENEENEEDKENEENESLSKSDEKNKKPHKHKNKHKRKSSDNEKNDKDDKDTSEEKEEGESIVDFLCSLTADDVYYNLVILHNIMLVFHGIWISRSLFAPYIIHWTILTALLSVCYKVTSLIFTFLGNSFVAKWFLVFLSLAAFSTNAYSLLKTAVFGNGKLESVNLWEGLYINNALKKLGWELKTTKDSWNPFASA